MIEGTHPVVSDMRRDRRERERERETEGSVGRQDDMRDRATRVPREIKDSAITQFWLK